MTVVDSCEPNRRIVFDPGAVERTAGVLESHAEAIAERTRLLVVDEMLGDSFGGRDTDASGSYRDTAEVFGDVARLLRDELDRGRRMLLSISADYRATAADAAAEQADGIEETGRNR